MNTKKLLEEGLINTLMDRMDLESDNMLSENNRLCAAFQTKVSLQKSDISGLTPKECEKMCRLSDELAKRHLGILDNIGISDIPKIEACKINLSMLMAGLAEMGIMAEMLNSGRKSAKFSENPMNVENIAKEKDMPKRIKAAESKVEAIASLLSDIASELKALNRKVQVRKYDAMK